MARKTRSSLTSPLFLFSRTAQTGYLQHHNQCAVASAHSCPVEGFHFPIHHFAKVALHQIRNAKEKEKKKKKPRETTTGSYCFAMSDLVPDGEANSVPGSHRSKGQEIRPKILYIKVQGTRKGGKSKRHEVPRPSHCTHAVLFVVVTQRCVGYRTKGGGVRLPAQCE